MIGKRAIALIVMVVGAFLLAVSIVLILTQISAVQAEAEAASPVLGGLARPAVMAVILIVGAIFTIALVILRAVRSSYGD